MRTPAPLLLPVLLVLAACGDSGAPAESAAPERVAVSLPAAYAAADTAPGAQEARKCALCHSFAADAPHSVGPNLHHVFGRPAGTAPGYSYSPALLDADFVWTPERLDAWLNDPNGFLPGTRMTFPGVYDEALRRSLIAWLFEETGGGGAQE